MNIQRIYSKNALYQKLEVLQTNRNKRYRYQEFLVEGVRNINEAVRNKWRIESFLYADGNPLSSWAEGLLRDVKTEVNYALSPELMKDLSKKEDASELMAVIRMRNDRENPFQFADHPILVLFDRPSNKGNLGTLLRSCDAFGIDGLIVTGHSVDLYDPDVVSASMGSFFHVPFMRLSDNNEIDLFISGLRKRFPNIKIIGTTAHKMTRIQDVDLTTPVLLMIGNETDGLNQHFTESCDVMATIPMSGASSASSLNVSCAATVLLYEAARQRGA